MGERKWSAKNRRKILVACVSLTKSPSSLCLVSTAGRRTCRRDLCSRSSRRRPGRRWTASCRCRLGLCRRRRRRAVLEVDAAADHLEVVAQVEGDLAACSTMVVRPTPLNVMSLISLPEFWPPLLGAMSLPPCHTRTYCRTPESSRGVTTAVECRALSQALDRFGTSELDSSAGMTGALPRMIRPPHSPERVSSSSSRATSALLNVIVAAAVPTTLILAPSDDKCLRRHHSGYYGMRSLRLCGVLQNAVRCKSLPAVGVGAGVERFAGAWSLRILARECRARQSSTDCAKGVGVPQCCGMTPSNKTPWIAGLPCSFVRAGGINTVRPAISAARACYVVARHHMLFFTLSRVSNTN